MAHDVGEGEAGSGVPLAHACMALKPLGTQHGCPEDAVADVRMGAMAVDAGCVGLADADVVKHGRLLHELAVDVQFRV